MTFCTTQLNKSWKLYYLNYPLYNSLSNMTDVQFFHYKYIYIYIFFSFFV